MDKKLKIDRTDLAEIKSRNPERKDFNPEKPDRNIDRASDNNIDVYAKNDWETYDRANNR